MYLLQFTGRVVGSARDTEPNEKEQKRTQHVRAQIADASDIMRENLQKIRERGDKINQVQQRYILLNQFCVNFSSML